MKHFIHLGLTVLASTFVITACSQNGLSRATIKGAPGQDAISARLQTIFQSARPIASADDPALQPTSQWCVYDRLATQPLQDQRLALIEGASFKQSEIPGLFSERRYDVKTGEAYSFAAYDATQGESAFKVTTRALNVIGGQNQWLSCGARRALTGRLRAVDESHLIMEMLESWAIFGCNQPFDLEATNAYTRQVLSAEDSRDFPDHFIKSYSYYTLKAGATCSSPF